ncbi:hypothetical protein B0T17DRAFT_110454 [Bombardia bombarda]|uniref:Secreted protein n=1 Tax=Bombardia bombarda TaxID=252184 RepID=A0AA39XQE1_9PEZI|nr:hypothetical protein B0T17DRAFT_110454 [Bombardia bombarda]
MFYNLMIPWNATGRAILPLPLLPLPLLLLLLLKNLCATCPSRRIVAANRRWAHRFPQRRLRSCHEKSKPPFTWKLATLHQGFWCGSHYSFFLFFHVLKFPSIILPLETAHVRASKRNNAWLLNERGCPVLLRSNVDNSHNRSLHPKFTNTTVNGTSAF